MFLEALCVTIVINYFNIKTTEINMKPLFVIQQQVCAFLCCGDQIIRV